MKINTNVHNRFEFELRDAHTGKIKQKEVSYNIILDNFFKFIGKPTHIYNIQIGTGTGTLDETRSGLFKFGSGAKATKTEVSYAYPVSSIQKKAVFGTGVLKNSLITEVGFSYGNTPGSLLETHSMLKDSEGNQIAISKGENDILTVYGTVYATFIAPDDSSIVIPQDPSKNIFLQSVLGEGESSRPQFFYFGMSNRLSDTTQYARKGALFSKANGFVAGSDPKIHTVTLPKVAHSEGNFGFISSVGGENTCIYLLPNSEFFPPVTLTNLNVGIADGVSTEYSSPIPLILKDSEVIRVNGVTQIRDVDYTFDHQNNATFDPVLFISADPNVSIRKGGLSSNQGTVFVVWDMAQGINYIEKNFPMYLDFEKEIIVDSLVVAKNSTREGDIFALSYSTDNVSWIACYTSTGNYTDDARERFTPIAARYWKLEAISTSILARVRPNICFGHSRPGLIFTVPPPEGATIEMDCKIDRPLKNENWELDFSMSVQYGRG